MEKYDENLQDNPFFVKLLAWFPTLYQDAPRCEWVICVPRCQTVQVQNCCHDDFQTHILSPLSRLDNDSEERFCTLNGKVVTISGGKILRSEDCFDTDPVVHILFEEIFYNRLKESFKVLCISGPLHGSLTCSINGEQRCLSLYECIGFLKQEVGSLSRIDGLLKKYVQLLHRPPIQNIGMLRKHFIYVYEKILKLANEDEDVRSKSLVSDIFEANLRLSVETYILHNMYKPMMKIIKDLYAVDDSGLNKIIRNLGDLQPKDLQITQCFWEAIPQAKRELSKIQSFSTPLEKVRCLKRTFLCLEESSKSPHRLSKAKTTYTTDDVLSLFVYLVLKAGVPNWIAHLMYLKNFSLHLESEHGYGENSFHVSTLEAAIEYVRSNVITLPVYSEGLIDDFQLDAKSTNHSLPLFPNEVDIRKAKAFFEAVKEGNLSIIESMLKLASEQVDEAELCHPLCVCDKCRLQQQKCWVFGRSYISLRDVKGNTALHLAVAYEREELIDVLIKAGADVEAVNSLSCTPLHIACKRGFQNIELLLLDDGANINAQDINGNTPLHWAASNSHSNCVKTLLYYNEHQDLNLNVNGPNHAGDTALHIASRFGYDEIVEILMQFGCDASLLNKIRQSPLDCAHNRKIINLIKYTCNETASYYSTLSPSDTSSANKSSAEVSAETPIKVLPKTEKPQKTSNFESTQKSRQLVHSVDHRVDKLLKAVRHNDMKLVCFYLGLNNDEIEDSHVDLPQDLCHPLCRCEKCRPVQEVASSQYQRVLAGGVSVNYSNEKGITPLHEGCAKGHDDIVMLLLRNGAVVNAQDCKNRAPLHVACRNNRPKIAEILLRNGALVNIVNVAGDTPLHYSCLIGAPQMSHLLIEKGANVNHANHRGDTPLHNAVRNNSKENVKLLLLNGATINLVNQKRETAQDLAKDSYIIKLMKTSVRSLKKRSCDSQEGTPEKSSIT